MKKTVLAICALIPVVAHSADNQTPFIVRFSDKPGIYKIKVESVKDFKVTKKDGKKHYTYTSLSSSIEFYTQQEGNDSWFSGESYWANLLSIPRAAQYVRISIRKRENEKFNRGGFTFIETNKLRDLETKLDMESLESLPASDRTSYAGITLKDQFENFAQGKGSYKIECDSMWLNI